MTVSPQLADAIYETTTGTGTSNLTLAGAESGHRGFAAVYGTGSTNTFFYKIGHQTQAEWEVGVGYMSDSTTLVRVTILLSSNSNSAVDFTGGTKDVTSDTPAAYQQFPQEIQTVTPSSAVSDVDFASGRHRFFDLTVARATKTPTAPTFVSGHAGGEAGTEGTHYIDLGGVTFAAGDAIVFAFTNDTGTHRIPTLVEPQYCNGFEVVRNSDTNSIVATVGIIWVTPEMVSALDRLVFVANGGWSAVCAIFRGVDPQIHDVSPPSEATGASGMPNPPSITPTTDNCMLVAIGALDDDVITMTAPSGYTLAAEMGYTTAGNATSTGIAYKVLASAAADDPGVFGGGGNDAWRAWTIALRPLDRWTQPSITFSNVPSGYFEATLLLDYDGVSTVTWPSGITWEGERGSTSGPPLIDGLNIVKLYTDDGGTSWYGRNESGGAHDDTLRVQEFTSSGTWIKPKGGRYTHARVRIVAGGGGAGAAFGAIVGGGGGGAGTPWVDFDLDDLGDRETVIVGAGGEGGSSQDEAGDEGGVTRFGAWLRAFGGGGSTGQSDASGAGAGGGALFEAGNPDNGNSGGIGGMGGDIDEFADGEGGPQTGGSSYGGPAWTAFGGGGGAGESTKDGYSVGGHAICGGGGGGGRASNGNGSSGGISMWGGGGGCGAEGNDYLEDEWIVGPGGQSLFAGNGGVGGSLELDDGSGSSGSDGFFPGGGAGGTYEDSKNAVQGGADGGDGYCIVVCH